ncbi:MAG: HEAT repeat domain-containing protein [Vicinamibacteria bacterium]|nr:HEAT repeat domain-containing protein [Vicinamibacteria bacterium]
MRKARPSFPLASFGAVLALVILVAAAGAWWQRGHPLKTDATEDRPGGRAGPSPGPVGYIDNRVCVGCHLDEGREWQESHHAKAMAAPTEQSVLGDFRNREFTLKGVTTRFFKRGEAFFVNTEGADGKLADFEIKYAFGVEPLQQYLVEMPDGRLQPLSIAWDNPKQRWFHLLPGEKTPPGDVLHWTGRYQTANTMCLVCHTTQFEKRYDPKTDTFASEWAEPNVSCQSCHGPGERHVAWEKNQRGAGTPLAVSPKEPHGLTVDIKGADASRKTELCAPCHSRRSELVPSPSPGESMLDDFQPSLLVQGLYHPDGQQLDEVYVDGSFRQSLMFQRGVTCTNCHNPHTGKLKVAGNGVCLQCHRPDPNPSFPSAVGNYDSPSHHFHKEGSAGAQCASCHMPSSTYMQIQRRPDHSIRVPRPDLSVKIGTPDACTNCHAGKNAQWAAQAVTRWYGPVRKQGTHYGEAFAAARAGERRGRDALAQLIGNPKTPAIVRASALADLQHDPAIGIAVRVEATRDAHPEVRAAAALSLGGLPSSQRIEALSPLLRDSVRAVRINAARELSSVPVELLEPSARAVFDMAIAEYIAAQNVALDMPGGHFNLAVVYENTGQRGLAERHYLGALKIDPDFTPARANLAQMYSAMSRNADAERVLVDGLKRMPRIGELQYALGLLLAEEKRMKEATEALAKAATLLPGNPSVQYNYGLALQEMGQRGPAESALLRAQRLQPDDPKLAYALAIFYAQSGRRDDALAWAETLRSLRPGDPQVTRLVERLRVSQ